MLIVTGMPGAGKDEFIKVAKSMGWKDFHMGDTVRKFARLNKIENTDREIGLFANHEREMFGKDIWAKRLSEDMETEKGVIVDGLRNMEEFEYFKLKFPDLILIAIHTDRDERLRRIKKRHRVDDVKDFTGLVKRDERELSWGIGNAISLAEYMIVNDSTLEEFKERSKELLLRLKKHELDLP